MGRQHGSALAVTLFVMLAALALGVSAARAALSAERAARAERDRHIALVAAEAALLDAERDIEGDGVPASRARHFVAGATAGFVEGCGRHGEANAGLCLYSESAPAWKQVDLAEGGSTARSVAYGTFTGGTLPAGAGTLPARLPRYLIEALPSRRHGEDASQPAASAYRITAIGFGPRASTRVVLQGVYRKAGP